MQSIATEQNAPKIIVVNNEKSKFNPTQQIKANTLSIAVSKNETNPTFKNSRQSKLSRNQLNEVDKLTLKKVLNSHFLFKDKNQEILTKIIQSIETKKYENGTELNTQDLFYIVKEGKLEITTE